MSGTSTLSIAVSHGSMVGFWNAIPRSSPAPPPRGRRFRRARGWGGAGRSELQDRRLPAARRADDRREFTLADAEARPLSASVSWPSPARYVRSTVSSRTGIRRHLSSRSARGGRNAREEHLVVRRGARQLEVLHEQRDAFLQPQHARRRRRCRSACSPTTSPRTRWSAGAAPLLGVALEQRLAFHDRVHPASGLARTSSSLVDRAHQAFHRLQLLLVASSTPPPSSNTAAGRTRRRR